MLFSFQVIQVVQVIDLPLGLEYETNENKQKEVGIGLTFARRKRLFGVELDLQSSANSKR